MSMQMSLIWDTALRALAPGSTITGLGGDIAIGANAAALWADVEASAVPRDDFAAPVPQYCAVSL